MTVHNWWFSLGIVLLLGFASGVLAQEPTGGRAGSGAKEADTPPAQKLEQATFGGGCFWCLEAAFERIPGVKAVVSGYAGGTVPNPSYEMVHTGLTGHAEVVQVAYDPGAVSYEDLLKVFWLSHDPTTPGRQGPDVGPQYRSVIFYRGDDQKRAAEQSIRALTDARVFAAPIVTELAPLTTLYPAEPYHQNYYRLNRGAPYCERIITPKLRKLEHALGGGTLRHR
jgi:peptide-methionine (S)-S-oxide reductase